VVKDTGSAPAESRHDAGGVGPKEDSRLEQPEGGPMAEKSFPEIYNRLRALLGKLGKELPGPMGGFGQLHKQTVADGALTAKVKELIALAVAVAVRCEGCIAFHTHDALKAGASRAEVLEAVGVAVLMGGGPSAMYACEALEALEQFQTASAAKS
jgi:AhpD family alkylhydroperoxidase